MTARNPGKLAILILLCLVLNDYRVVSLLTKIAHGLAGDSVL
jgi:hypothetical protein